MEDAKDKIEGRRTKPVSDLQRS
ncbi:hypothetical protein CCACVL1_04418 [Corchorus capsularis]|uniref:Uncharacterized protein n=1 Tax=Corchorus capsularis TaxID=210143 RepID=A0A1R3JT09_COCAP|nr:hypothetical protein CCACVL1_04418 [Corchorus capsularis]